MPKIDTRAPLKKTHFVMYGRISILGYMCKQGGFAIIRLRSKFDISKRVELTSNFKFCINLRQFNIDYLSQLVLEKGNTTMAMLCLIQ